MNEHETFMPHRDAKGNENVSPVIPVPDYKSPILGQIERF